MLHTYVHVHTHARTHAHTHTHTHTHTPRVDSGDEGEPGAVLGEWFNEVASGQLCGSDAVGVEIGTRVGHRH